MHFDDTTPIYIQIADDIRHQILIGALADGDRVMSTTAYAKTYRINPATAAKAFTLLTDEGLIVKRRGIGMFVAPGAKDSLTRAGRTNFIDDSFAPVVAQGLALGLTEDDLTSALRTIIAATPHPEEQK